MVLNRAWTEEEGVMVLNRAWTEEEVVWHHRAFAQWRDEHEMTVADLVEEVDRIIREEFEKAMETEIQRREIEDLSKTVDVAVGR